MCRDTCNKSSSRRRLFFYALAVGCGICGGCSGIPWLFELAKFCSEAFIRLFRCIGMPVIALSVIVALSSSDGKRSIKRVWRRTLFYTLTTTVCAVLVAAVLYLVIAPSSVYTVTPNASLDAVADISYGRHLLQIIPDNLVKAFSECQVLTVLFISVVTGLSIRAVPNPEARQTVRHFFEGFHGMLFTIINGIVKLLPIGLFGFIAVGVRELNVNGSLQGMGAYFLVVTLANVLQGILVLPLFLLLKGQRPLRIFKGMAPALSVAFFTKSSAGTLPVTMQRAETKLNIRPEISRFVLPLCTTINMNGCGAFIFTTVLYVMQNNGFVITPTMMLPWIFVATLAAVGNAGVPMGCFFLSASLLSSMNVPLELMGMILPIYSVIDMLETALNVWSDSCVAVAVNQDMATVAQAS